MRIKSMKTTYTDGMICLEAETDEDRRNMDMLMELRRLAGDVPRVEDEDACNDPDLVTSGE